jgi:hypothetical protein
MTAQPGKGTAEQNKPRRDLAASLADSDRQRQVGHSTRRVVMASMGVLNDQKATRKRSRSLALAAVVVMILFLSPLVWVVVDHFSSGGHLGDLTTEFNLWVCILCPALLAAALMAGWLRKR